MSPGGGAIHGIQIYLYCAFCIAVQITGWLEDKGDGAICGIGTFRQGGAAIHGT